MSKNPNPIDVEVGRRVCAKRLSLGRSQSDMAQAVGLTFQQIQKYEKGANRISASKLVEIAEFLRCEPADLLPRKGDVDPGASPIPMAATRKGSELARIFEALDEPRQRFLLNMARSVTAIGAPAAS